MYYSLKKITSLNELTSKLYEQIETLNHYYFCDIKNINLK